MTSIEYINTVKFDITEKNIIQNTYFFYLKPFLRKIYQIQKVLPQHKKLQLTKTQCIKKSRSFLKSGFYLYLLSFFGDIRTRFIKFKLNMDLLIKRYSKRHNNKICFPHNKTFLSNKSVVCMGARIQQTS